MLLKIMKCRRVHFSLDLLFLARLLLLRMRILFFWLLRNNRCQIYLYFYWWLKVLLLGKKLINISIRIASFKIRNSWDIQRIFKFILIFLTFFLVEKNISGRHFFFHSFILYISVLSGLIYSKLLKQIS